MKGSDELSITGFTPDDVGSDERITVHLDSREDARLSERTRVCVCVFVQCYLISSKIE